MLLKKQIAALIAIVTGSIATGLPSSAQESTSADQKPSTASKNGHHKHKHVGIIQRCENIKQLSSITDKQKQQIDQALSAYKEEMTPLRQQFQSLRSSAKSATATGSSDAGTKVASSGEGSSKAESTGANQRTANQDQMMELRKQFLEKSRETMKKVLSILTPEQKLELKNLRKNGKSDTQAQPNEQS